METKNQQQQGNHTLPWYHLGMYHSDDHPANPTIPGGSGQGGQDGVFNLWLPKHKKVQFVAGQQQHLDLGLAPVADAHGFASSSGGATSFNQQITDWDEGDVTDDYAGDDGIDGGGCSGGDEEELNDRGDGECYIDPELRE